MTPNGKHRFGEHFPEDHISLSTAWPGGDYNGPGPGEPGSTIIYESPSNPDPNTSSSCLDTIDIQDNKRTEHQMSDEEQLTVDILNRDYGCIPDEVGLGNLSSSVQLHETTATNQPVDTYRAGFMAGKETEFAATLEAYAEIYGRELNSHSLALNECRTFATLAREKTSGDVQVMSNACRDRWCPMCANQKVQYAKDQTAIYIKGLVNPRFLTLTLRHDERSLKDQIEFLQLCFRKLRYRAYWKKNVTGGIWFLQIKRGKNSGLWHPHFHILLDGEYMEQAKLSDLWDLVTFGSPIIDIRSVWDADSAASEIARYVARPAELSKMPMTDRVEVIEALQGKRLCGTFGTAKTVTLTPPKIEDSCEWQTIGCYDQVVHDARNDLAARAILDAYHSYEPISESAFELYTGKPVHYDMPEYKPYKPKQFMLDFYHS